MKRIIFLILAVFAVAFISFKVSIPKTNNHPVTAVKGFALVELFTSEGCSSCPAADAVVARIQNEDKDIPVYILAYHVDYWNHLGWKDEFSSSDYSKRQQQYASWLHSDVYTPQIIINGSKEFVGSEESTLRNSIKYNLQNSNNANVTINNTSYQSGKISVNYNLLNIEPQAQLSLAVVQKYAQSNVSRGENKGRKLSHVQIVRELKTVDIKNKLSGNVTLQVPSNIPSDQLEVIAFTQNMVTGKILGATKSLVK